MSAERHVPFSRRHGHQRADAPITIREDAPTQFRCAVLQIAKSTGNLSPSSLREIVCGVLRERPSPSNWSEYPNIWDEVQNSVHSCEWFRVYDIVEKIHAALFRHVAIAFENEINDCFEEMGIGWQLCAGLVQNRGDDAFEAALVDVSEKLEAASLPTAKSELAEAVQDLSRRPAPDLSGAVQHAMAALECVAREVADDRKATLGEIIKKHPGVIPRPLDEAVSKAWGYASEQARHGREERDLGREEVELIVGLAAVVSAYLAQKLDE